MNRKEKLILAYVNNFISVEAYFPRLGRSPKKQIPVLLTICTGLSTVVSPFLPALFTLSTLSAGSHHKIVLNFALKKLTPPLQLPKVIKCSIMFGGRKIFLKKGNTLSLANNDLLNYHFAP